MSGLIFIFAKDIAWILGANDVLINDSVAYIEFGLYLILCDVPGDYVIKAMGHPLYATSVMATSVVINIVLAICMVGVLGQGVKGAVLSEGIAFTVGY